MLKRIPIALALAALLSLSPLTADACTVEEGPFGFYQVDPDCNLLEERFAELAEGIELRTVPKLRVMLPDLVPVDGNMDQRFDGADLFELEVKIANRGNKDAGPFEVTTLFEVRRGGNLIVTNTQTVLYQNGLDAGDDLRLYMTNAVPYQPEFGDAVTMIIFTDSGGGGVAQGGDVGELNEGNNVGLESCAIFAAPLLCDDGPIEILTP